MKHFLFLLFFLYATTGFSQSEYQTFIDKYEEFTLYAKPNKTNNLSKYFAKRIDSRLIDSYRITDTIKNKKYIYLTFRLDKLNKVVSIIVNSPYSELNKSIRDAFKDLDIEDLNIAEKSPLNIYTLQILSQENNKMVINCSTNVVYDRNPVFEGCESSATKSKLCNCFNSKLSEYIANTISPRQITKAKILGKLNLHVKFLINEKGVIEQINCKAPTDSLTKELNRIVALFPKAKSPATRNGRPTSFIYVKNIDLQIDSKNKEYTKEVEEYNGQLYSNDSFLNPNSDLALHFKKYISEKELNDIPLIDIPVLSIYFDIDKTGNPINIKTNANTELNNQLVAIFRYFPFKKLNIKPLNTIDSYSYPIIINRCNKNIIMSNEKPFVHTPPIFDKDCHLSGSKELDNCMNENIKTMVVNNFKRTIGNKTNLTGIIKISFSFQIDAEGKITNVKAFAPNPSICNELEELIKNISEVYKPAYLNGNAVPKVYSYSYRFDLGKNKVDEFKNLIKTYY
ncbi:hypothetical protein GCM10011518_39570 [Flavobacterium limi]|uniref:TonB protein C-terminal n=1 Tax=Flavobacterium limi TaxID=2045105 RepID=A0ABQ1UVG7_9FLAO|nr:hypothetical protein GCM10011518_39570 [Flavobacterium limi]